MTTFLMFVIVIVLLIVLILFVIKDDEKIDKTYIDEIEESITKSTLDGTYYIMKNGNLCLGIFENQECDGDILEINVSNEVPNSGFVTIKSGVIIDISLVYENSEDNNSDDDLDSNIPITKACKVTSGSAENIGDEITCAEEKFYVLNNDGEYIKMLSMYNLDVGSIYDPNLWEATEIKDPTGIQSSKALGYIPGDNVYYGVVKYSNIEHYIKSYEDYLKKNGVNSASVSIISYDELKKLGCKDYLCTNAPSFVYATSYCTSTVSDDYVWAVSFDGNIDLESKDTYRYGVRPVVSILIEEI